MDWKRVVGKLFLAGAGGGGLVLLMFVFLPWLTAQVETPGAVGSEEIVDEALSLTVVDEADEFVAEGVARDSVMPAPSPVVAVRDNGEEVAVVFPAAAEEETQEETLTVAGQPAREERDALLSAPVADLPPVLSSEEVNSAMAGLEASAGEPLTADPVTSKPVGEASLPGFEDALPAETTEPWTGPAAEQTGAMPAQGGHPEVVPVTDPGGPRRVEVTLMPSSSATRDVQELLEALGYAPGPLDGIWGERTAGAWRNFARDAADRAALTELTEAHFEDNAEPSAAEIPAPAGETVETEGSGAGQAGSPHAGLPPQEDAQPVVVPGTLRGVMGYRMPLVSRQGVPDQVVSGVLIPAHTTFVILKPGYWELIGLEPGEVERLRDASRRREFQPPTETVKSGWSPLRLLRKQGSSGHAK